jgi:hypothetical protein
VSKLWRVDGDYSVSVKALGVAERVTAGRVIQYLTKLSGSQWESYTVSAKALGESLRESLLGIYLVSKLFGERFVWKRASFGRVASYIRPTIDKALSELLGESLLGNQFGE